MEDQDKEGKKFWDVRWPEQIKRSAAMLVGSHKTFPRSVRLGAGAVVLAFFGFFFLANRFYPERLVEKTARSSLAEVQENASMGGVWDDLQDKLNAAASEGGAAVEGVEGLLKDLVALAEDVGELEGVGLSLFFGDRGGELIKRLRGIRERLGIIEARQFSKLDITSNLDSGTLTSSATPFHLPIFPPDPEINRAGKTLDALIGWLDAELPRRIQVNFEDGGSLTLFVRGGGVSAIERATSPSPDAVIFFVDRELDELMRINGAQDLGADVLSSAEKFLRLAPFFASAGRDVNIETLNTITSFLKKGEIRFHFEDGELQNLFEAEENNE